MDEPAISSSLFRKQEFPRFIEGEVNPPFPRNTGTKGRPKGNCDGGHLLSRFSVENGVRDARKVLYSLRVRKPPHGDLLHKLG